ncbi:MAG TPA: ECF-type sigma factor [Rudaea sp.]|nr:ECF-type sigma factor [Rudaea sp.]
MGPKAYWGAIMATAPDFTQLLAASRGGDHAAWSKLVLMIYADLRRLARRRGSGGAIPTTLGTTGLVHECYLRLAGSPRERIEDRGHFFNLASRIMRQILCDYARRSLRVKRGTGQDHEDIDAIDAAEHGEVENLVALDDLLTRLDAENPAWAKVFECRFFAGLSEEETAQAMSIPLRTAQRNWHEAREWLAQRMR